MNEQQRMNNFNRQCELRERIGQLEDMIEKTSVMTREEAKAVEVPEGKHYHAFPAMIGGWFTRVRLVPQRDGSVTYHEDWRTGRINLINERKEAVRELGLMIAEEHGIMLDKY